MPLLALHFSSISKQLYKQMQLLGLWDAFLLKLNYLLCSWVTTELQDSTQISLLCENAPACYKYKVNLCNVWAHAWKCRGLCRPISFPGKNTAWRTNENGASERQPRVSKAKTMAYFPKVIKCPHGAEQRKERRSRETRVLSEEMTGGGKRGGMRPSSLQWNGWSTVRRYVAAAQCVKNPLASITICLGVTSFPNFGINISTAIQDSQDTQPLFFLTSWLLGVDCNTSLKLHKTDFTEFTVIALGLKKKLFWLGWW